MTSPRVVLVGPADSYRLGPFVLAAERLGADLVVVTDHAGALPASTLATRLQPPPSSSAELDALLAAAGARLGGPPDAIVPTDAAALILVARLAERCDRTLRSNDATAMAISLDKARQRQAVATTGVRQPAFCVVHPGHDGADAAFAVGLPAVVKPLSLTASRGVLRVDDPLDARAAVTMVHSMLTRGEAVLVERFVAGGEVAVEGLLDDGRLHVLAIFDKPDAPQGPTFPETVLIAPSRLGAELQRQLAAATATVCSAVGLRHGPVHVEFRIDAAGRPWFLELAARTIGGRCASMLRFADGTGLEDAVLRQALGLPFDTAPADAAFGVHMVPIERSGVVRAVHGVEEATAVPGVAEVAIEVAVGDAVVALPNGGGYGGFIFARGASPEAVEAALAKASTAVVLVIGRPSGGPTDRT